MATDAVSPWIGFIQDPYKPRYYHNLKAFARGIRDNGYARNHLVPGKAGMTSHPVAVYWLEETVFDNDALAAISLRAAEAMVDIADTMPYPGDALWKSNLHPTEDEIEEARNLNLAHKKVLDKEYRRVATGICEELEALGLS